MKLALPVDVDNVFASLEKDRAAGVLSDTITTATVRYQTSATNSRCLERIDIDGTITLGNFVSGRFVPFENK